jgi:hypothetical protein
MHIGLPISAKAELCEFAFRQVSKYRGRSDDGFWVVAYGSSRPYAADWQL